MRNLIVVGAVVVAVGGGSPKAATPLKGEIRAKSNKKNTLHINFDNSTVKVNDITHGMLHSFNSGESTYVITKDRIYNINNGTPLPDKKGQIVQEEFSNFINHEAPTEEQSETQLRSSAFVLPVNGGTLKIIERLNKDGRDDSRFHLATSMGAKKPGMGERVVTAGAFELLQGNQYVTEYVVDGDKVAIPDKDGNKQITFQGYKNATVTGHERFRIIEDVPAELVADTAAGSNSGEKPTGDEITTTDNKATTPPPPPPSSTTTSTPPPPPPPSSTTTSTPPPPPPPSSTTTSTPPPPPPAKPTLKELTADEVKGLRLGQLPSGWAYYQVEDGKVTAAEKKKVAK